jgi:hypothetical protein
MKLSWLRLLVLLWLGWYISGPLCETVDTWDAPHEELRDIAFNAGGALGLMAAAFSAGAAVLRKVRQLCRAATRCRRRAPCRGASVVERCVLWSPSPLFANLSFHPYLRI